MWLFEKTKIAGITDESFFRRKILVIFIYSDTDLVAEVSKVIMQT